MSSDSMMRENNLMKNGWRRLVAVLGATVLAWTPVGSPGQTQFQGWCSEVEIEIVQELTFERIGFEATLEVTNNDGFDAITDFAASLTFEDPEKDVGDPDREVSDKFFVRAPVLQNVNRVDGTGVIQPTKTAIVKWFIIPKIAAGGESPAGKRYQVGCDLGGKLQGVEIPASNMFAIPDTITVKPEPQLRISYFQPKNVTGDDPFTVDIAEQPIPFTLGVIVHNEGYGTAKTLKIDSQQPKIVDNQNGLLLVAQLLGARVMDSELDEDSLLLDFGDLEPGETVKGAWDMIVSLSGHFLDFNARYTHASELGGEETSLITSLEAHFSPREVINDDPGRDAVRDFLADIDRDSEQVPDALYETEEGNILPVNYINDGVVSGTVAGNDVKVDVVSSFENWVYIRVNDPAQNALPVTGIVRSDGKVINPHNFWQSLRYRYPDNAKLTFVHIFDKVANGAAYTYDLTYDLNPTDLDPPETRIRFAGDHSEDGGVHYITRDTQIYFTAEDENPVSIQYKIDAGAFVPALPFKISSPGSYVITYFSEDLNGNIEVEQTATVAINGDRPLIADYSASVGNLFLAGSAEVISVRPDQAKMDITVGASPVEVDGVLDIFRGVVAWPRVSGVPPTPTPVDSATLQVSGDHVDFYRYRINGGAWNAEMPVAQTIDLSGLGGAVNVEILGRSRYGGYLDESEALAVSWVVSAAAPLLTVAGLPPTPMPDAGMDLVFGGAPELTDYRWNIDDSYFRAEMPIATPLELRALDPADHVLKIRGKRAGDWQESASATEVRWTQDHLYGSDFSMLTKVKTTELPDVGGQAISNMWDGTNDDGVPQLPGYYTARLTLTDELGRTSFETQLLQIENLSSGEQVLADAAADPANADAEGNLVVWQQRVGSIWNIFAKDLTAGGLPVPVTAEPRGQENPRTDGRYVVWQGRQVNGSTDLFLYDFVDMTVAQLTSTPERHEVNAVVEYPWVVYQQKPVGSESAPWQLEAMNLETVTTVAVDTTLQNQLDVEIHAGRVVWQDWRDVGPGEIYFKDLETGETRRITEQTDGQYHPDIHGHQIVWQDNRATQLDIWGYDLRVGVERRLTDTPANEVNVTISDGWLVYREDSLGPLTNNLRMQDLTSGESVGLTAAMVPHSLGSLGNGFGVWTRGEVGSRELVASFLPSLQPVVNNHNTVVVTDALAAEHGSAFSLLTEWQADAGVAGVTRYESFGAVPVTKTATWDGASAVGDDFALAAGDFLWVRFDDAKVLDLGDATPAAVDIAGGKNALSYGAFPVGYTAYDFIDDVGEGNVAKVRMLDALRGEWREVEVTAGGRLGANFAIPRVAALLVDMTNPVNGWRP